MQDEKKCIEMTIGEEVKKGGAWRKRCANSDISSFLFQQTTPQNVSLLTICVMACGLHLVKCDVCWCCAVSLNCYLFLSGCLWFNAPHVSPLRMMLRECNLCCTSLLTATHTFTLSRSKHELGWRGGDDVLLYLCSAISIQFACDPMHSSARRLSILN